MRTIVFALLLVFCAGASAGDRGYHHDPTPRSNVTRNVTNTTNNASASASTADSQSASSVTVGGDDELQAPPVYAPSVYASGSCAYGWSAGLAVPGGGITGGKSKPDDDCNRREAARVVSAFDPTLALLIMCRDPAVLAVESYELCSARAVKLFSAQAARDVESARREDLSKYATHDEVEKAFKRSQAK